MDIGGAQVQALVARKRQQLAGQLAAAFAGAAGDLGLAFGVLVLRQVQDQVHAALDHVEQVVEIMRDAARQAPHRLHLLQLHHGQLHPLALDDFIHQAVIRLRQRARAFLDARFQRLVQLQQLGPAVAQAFRHAHALAQDLARLVLALAPAQGRSGGAAQGFRIERTFQQDDIAQLVEGAARRLRRHAIVF